MRQGAMMSGAGKDKVWDEAALEAFVAGPDFDAFLLDCFEQGIREAVAEQRALGIAEPEFPQSSP